MTRAPLRNKLSAIGCAVVLACTGCGFHGANSLALPGTVGKGPGASVYHVEMANVSALQTNSPVMIGDVIVGSVGEMKFVDWHAEVDVSVGPDVVVPANAVATVGQTSLLGSMHLALDPPLGQRPTGRLAPGATISLDKSVTYPSTEQTLAMLSTLVNGGGLGQIGEIIHTLNAGLSGNQTQVRDLLTRLSTFVGTLNAQRDNIVASIRALDRLAISLAGERDTITSALRTLPAALDVLLRERPHLTTALDKLRVFADTANRIVNNAGGDLIADLHNLEPTLRAVADVGRDLDTILAYAPTYPFTQDLIDRAIRGDYMNLDVTLDFTINRLKRSLFLGTRWGQPNAPLVPAPGDPWYLNYTYDPLSAPITPQSAPGAPPGLLPPAPTPSVAAVPLPDAQLAPTDEGGR